VYNIFGVPTLGSDILDLGSYTLCILRHDVIVPVVHPQIEGCKQFILCSLLTVCERSL